MGWKTIDEITAMQGISVRQFHAVYQKLLPPVALRRVAGRVLVHSGLYLTAMTEHKARQAAGPKSAAVNADEPGDFLILAGVLRMARDGCDVAAHLANLADDLRRGGKSSIREAIEEGADDE